MELNGNRIVLTGAASGIGFALFQKLARYDVTIIAVDINRQALTQAFESIDGRRARLFPYVCDLSIHQEVDGLFDYALETMAGIDLFIANAGFAYYEKLQLANWEHIDAIFRLNVYSPIYATQKMAHINGSRRFKVVIVASAMAHVALAGYTLYSSTKAALERFVDGYRHEMPPASSLMLVYPIATRTNFFEAQQSEEASAPVPFPSQTPDYVAESIISGIERDLDILYPSHIYRFGRLFTITRWLMRQYAIITSRRAFQKWLKAKHKDS